MFNNTTIESPKQKTPLPRGTEKSVILFLDDQHIEYQEGLKREFYSPQKIAKKPFLHTGQVPWEKIPLIFGSVKFDPIVSRYRMWYICCRKVNDGTNIHDNPALALSESQDCYNWTRPELDLIDFVDEDGKKHKTNLVFESDEQEHYIETGNVMIFPDAPFDKRYLMIYCAWENKNQTNRYYRLAYSSDGINWKRANRIPTIDPCIADRHCLVYDDKNDNYLLYSRAHKDFKVDFPTPDPAERIVTFQQSGDLIEWSQPKVIMECDKDDRLGENIYSLCPFFRGKTLVGIYQLHNQHRSIETVRTYLTWSHDKIHWDRKSRNEFIELGTDSQWDRCNTSVSDRPLILNDDMLFFYSGRSYRHGGYIPKDENYKPEYFSGISIATMKIDRFASLSPENNNGYLLTKEFYLNPEANLLLNCDCNDGNITVDFIHEQNTISSCQIKNQSGTRIPLQLPEFTKDKKVSMKISLNNALLYAIYNELE